MFAFNPMHIWLPTNKQYPLTMDKALEDTEHSGSLGKQRFIHETSKVHLSRYTLLVHFSYVILKQSLLY